MRIREKIRLLAGAILLMGVGAVHAIDYDWTTGTGDWLDTGWTTNGVAVTPVWDSSADGNIIDGTMNLTPSSRPTSTIRDVYVNPTSGGSPVLNISGDLSGRTILLGHSGSSGSATINQTAGTIDTTGYGYIGYKGTAANTYNLHGGTWNSSGANFYVGDNAGPTGTLDINGGTLNASGNYFGVAHNANSAGTLNIANGTLAHTGSDYFTIGRSGVGTSTIGAGGTLSSTAKLLTLGYYSDGSATLHLNGGAIQHTASGSGTYFLIGRSGNATLNMNGGTLESSAQRFAVGYYSSSTSAMNLNSGLLKFTGDYFYVGNAGSGTLYQSGGTNETTGLIIADDAGSDGLYSISGGTLTASKYFDLHTAGSVFEVDGSGADTIEAGAILVRADGTLRFKLDGNGTTLMKAVGGYHDRGIELTNATVEVETLAGFNGTVGDTYDLMWTDIGFMTNDMTFVNNSGTDFDWDIVSKDGGEAFQLTVIPEPATLGMFALMGGSIVFIRRKFMI